MMRLLLWVSFAVLCLGGVITAICVCACRTDADPAVWAEFIGALCAYALVAALFGIVIFAL